MQDEPALPGTAELDAVRARLLAQVQAQPELFVRRPEYAATDDPGIIRYRRWLSETRHPGSVLEQLFEVFRGHPEYARATLLRDGYLYAEHLLLARALVRAVRAEILFTDPKIWIQRGERLFGARRTKDGYVYIDGLEKGKPVSLLLFDRVGSGVVPPAVHRDVRALRYRLHFDRLSMVRLSETHVVADLEYGRHSVRTLLRARGPRLDPVCEVVPEGQEEAVARVRSLEELRDRAFRSVQRAILAEVEEQLPFDEPKHEVGQEDGKLRPLWRWAYDAGHFSYRFHEDEYPVFNAMGRPAVPEVCVDYLLDSIERASGTWWRPRGEPRGRVVGGIDFEQFDREELRRVPRFVEFARQHPSWFEVLEIPWAERIELGDPAIYDYLLSHHRDFIVGDMLLIGGYAPWDLRRYIHYHSFFVFESDPLTGIPIVISGNPGTPRLSPPRWEFERTPHRTLRYRIRPRPDWLFSVVSPEPPGELEPPPLHVTAP